MYKEEKVIDGMLHYRYLRTESFDPYTNAQLTDMLLELRRAFESLNCPAKEPTNTQ